MFTHRSDFEKRGEAPPAKAHAETRLFYRIAKEVLRSDQTLHALLDAVVAHLADYGFERPAITLQDPTTGEVRLEACHGVERRHRRRGRYRVGEGIEGHVVQGGKPTVVAALDKDPRYLDKARVRRDLDASRIAFVCVPIVTYRGAIVGTLGADRPSAPESELQWDRRLLTAVAALIGERVGDFRDRRDDDASRSRERRARAEAPPAPKDIVGSSHAMQAVFTLMEQVAPSDTPVLLRGESGTGKELVAKGIHDASLRSAGPFVSVNCGALPEPLVESELFGHAKGAFTGAANARRGRFEMANGGTLFLDEVGELPPSMQVKLLRALQSGEIHPVGEERARRVDVRVIAATNADLEKAIAAGRFREDLFYRLNVFPIYLPPLRERKTDITLLADHFVLKYARQSRRKVVRISTPAIDLMTAYHWPGNVRELENCIARAVLLTDDGVIRAHHLPPTLQTGDSSGTTKRGALETMMQNYEREILIEAMKNAGGNMTEAARALQTTPRIVAYRLRQLGLHHTLASRRRRGRGAGPLPTD